MVPSVSLNSMTLAHRHTYSLSEQLKLSIRLELNSRSTRINEEFIMRIINACSTHMILSKNQKKKLQLFSMLKDFVIITETNCDINCD